MTGTKLILDLFVSAFAILMIGVAVSRSRRPMAERAITGTPRVALAILSLALLIVILIEFGPGYFVLGLVGAVLVGGLGIYQRRKGSGPR